MFAHIHESCSNSERVTECSKHANCAYIYIYIWSHTQSPHCTTECNAQWNCNDVNEYINFLLCVYWLCFFSSFSRFWNDEWAYRYKASNWKYGNYFNLEFTFQDHKYIDLMHEYACVYCEMALTPGGYESFRCMHIGTLCIGDTWLEGKTK